MKKKTKYEHGPLGDWKRMRKKIDKLQEQHNEYSRIHGANAGDEIGVDYFLLGEVLDFLVKADYDMHQLAKIQELMQTMG